MTYKEDFDNLKNIIEKHLDKYIPVDYPNDIFNSMRYSTLAGGKRLRPVITLEVARMISGSFEKAIPTACAIEMLHTQSLIHDDLPCMDNDDYRRGRLTNHKVYGDATATLAGDALLSFAPQLILRKSKDILSAEQILAVLDEFFTAAGVYGIIGGQVVDIESEKKKIDEKTLDYIHEYKTAKLFTLAFKAGAIIAGADKKIIDDMVTFSQLFGHAFQIYDDILDEIATLEELGKTPGKDKTAEKNTYTSMFGLEKAKEQVYTLCNSACDILKKNNYSSPILEGIINDIKERIS
ncbi:MAG: polyprenyl synthetase family protein [Candidatus Gastranaerophilales bacterium]|nr:polyprenyl synthetase family protein [Candidatus Gastranaerophilales bacterium]